MKFFKILTAVLIAGVISHIGWCQNTKLVVKEKNESMITERREAFSQQLASMVDREMAYRRVPLSADYAFVIFEYNDDIYVQSKSHTANTIVLDLPIQILNADRIKLLKQYYSDIHETIGMDADGVKELVSYQIYFGDKNIQNNIKAASKVADDIFINVFHLNPDYSLRAVITDQNN